MTDKLFETTWAVACMRTRPLGCHLGGFASLLLEQGYAESCIRTRLQRGAELSRWLAGRGLDVAELDEDKLDEFMGGLSGKSEGQRRIRSVLQRLLDHLRDAGVVPDVERVMDDSAVGRVIGDYRQYLRQERGLTENTLKGYLPAARSLLGDRFGADPVVLGELESAHVRQFVLRYACGVSPGTAKAMVVALRSFLRFLRLRGDIATDLAAAVPTVANWRLSSVPVWLKPDEVARLLSSCDQSTVVGQRDFTVLLLLARLGLRAGEIVAMLLDDIDWRAGVLSVRGKGCQRHQLPLPQDVGEALATLLRDGRPRCSSRRVFVRLRAPHRAFASSVAISSIVERAVERAGLQPARKGAHILRHTLATEMLRQGASLAEIGQILRHSSTTSTEIYAKVDLPALRQLAQPWPGAIA